MCAALGFPKMLRAMTFHQVPFSPRVPLSRVSQKRKSLALTPWVCLGREITLTASLLSPRKIVQTCLADLVSSMLWSDLSSEWHVGHSSPLTPVQNRYQQLPLQHCMNCYERIHLLVLDTQSCPICMIWLGMVTGELRKGRMSITKVFLYRSFAKM